MTHETHVPAVTALLRHEPRDAPPHFDWLVEVAIPTPDSLRGEGDRVPTFRLPARLDTLDAGAAVAVERIPDHRRLYAELAEPRELSEGRGLVTPLGRGSIVEFKSMLEPVGFEATIAWHREPPIRQRLRLTRATDDRWMVEILANE